MPVAELLSRISSKELTKWMIFYGLEPFGSDAYYLGTGIVASTVANSTRGKNKQAYKVNDFMPKPKRPQSVDDMIGIAAHITAAMGGKDKR